MSIWTTYSKQDLVMLHVFVLAYSCSCSQVHCHNPSFGFATKARACKVAGQEGSPGVTPHALKNVGKCEGMNPHILKGVSTLGIEVSMDSRIFREWLQGSKLNELRFKVILGKLLTFKCLKWARMTHLDTSNTNYGQKKGRESNCQFDSRPLKVRNCLDFLMCRWCATYR